MSPRPQRSVTIARSQLRRRAAMAALGAIAAGYTYYTYAQPAPGADALGRPPEVRPELPGFQRPERPSLTLPPIPALPDDSRLSGLARVWVRSIVVEGATVIPQAELRTLVAPYENRAVSAEELQELRRLLTLYYVERGYINSGALLPDQEVTDGVVRFRLVEGTLNEIDVAHDGRLRPGYVSERIRIGAGATLNLAQLQERLQLLQQDRLIETVNAELRPGIAPGESRLQVTVKEANPIELSIGVNNYRSPSVGANRIEAFAAHRNVTGRGDSLDLRYGLTSGLDDYSLGYALPISAHDTRIAVRFSASDALVVESPFQPLDIKSKSTTHSLALTHPLMQTPTTALTIGLAAERRASDSTLLGQPFSFSAGIPDGKSRVTPWRLSVDWLKRNPDRVVALRSTWTSGSTNAGAKVNGIGPDGSYSTLLVQMQWAQRLSGLGNQLLARADIQETRDSLLSLEKLGMGGIYTVRGYRENLLLRDRGYILSLEYRHPLTGMDSGGSSLQLLAFLDRAHGTNRDPPPSLPQSIASAGVGALWNPRRQVQAQLYYGKALRYVATPTRELPDRGVHFSLVYQFF